MKFYLDFHRVTWVWWRTLTNGSDVKYIERHQKLLTGEKETHRKTKNTGQPSADGHSKEKNADISAREPKSVSKNRSNR